MTHPSGDIQVLLGAGTLGGAVLLEQAGRVQEDGVDAGPDGGEEVGLALRGHEPVGLLIQEPLEFQGRRTAYPHVEADRP